MNCIIVNDNAQTSTLLADFIAQTPSLYLSGTFTNTVAALSSFHKNTPDLVFLATQLLASDETEFMELLQGDVLVVITSNDAHDAWRYYQYNVIDYLLQPISVGRFLKAVKKVVNGKHVQTKGCRCSIGNVSNFTLVKTEVKGKIVRVNIDDIGCIEGKKNYVDIHTQSESITTFLSIQDVERDLLSSHFVRVHKSYVVNWNKISAIVNGQIFLNDCTISPVPVGTTYRKHFYRILRSHMLGMRNR